MDGPSSRDAWSPSAHARLLRERLRALHDILASAESDHGVLQRFLLREAISSMDMGFGSIGFVREAWAIRSRGRRGDPRATALA